MVIGKIDLFEQFHQFQYALLKHREAPMFIRKHKLWEGFWRYGWVSRMLVVIALLIGIKLFSIFWNWWGKAELDDLGSAVSSMGMLAGDFFKEGFDYLFLGGMKYVMLILMEVLVFHFCRRTVSILTGKDSPASFDDFFKAQVRMIRVSIRSWIRESIVTVLLGVAFGVAGFLHFLEPVAVFIVQCYYLGFTIVDNYNEQFGLSVKESAQDVYERHAGVALAVGAVLNVLLVIPLLGAVVAPFLSAVAATLVMFELSDLHRRAPVGGLAAGDTV